MYDFVVIFLRGSFTQRVTTRRDPDGSGAGRDTIALGMHRTARTPRENKWDKAQRAIAQSGTVRETICVCGGVFKQHADETFMKRGSHTRVAMFILVRSLFEIVSDRSDTVRLTSYIWRPRHTVQMVAGVTLFFLQSSGQRQIHTGFMVP